MPSFKPIPNGATIGAHKQPVSTKFDGCAICCDFSATALRDSPDRWRYAHCEQCLHFTLTNDKKFIIGVLKQPAVALQP
jgi:hypothetical protein